MKLERGEKSEIYRRNKPDSRTHYSSTGLQRWRIRVGARAAQSPGNIRGRRAAMSLRNNNAPWQRGAIAKVKKYGKQNFPTFNERCKQSIQQARKANPDEKAVIGHLALRLVMTQNTVALHLQRLKRLLQGMEEETWRQK
jgi:hypothetical protein